ncbi:prepilin peptidase [Candidatus Curtissbacteria bacterium]|nr:prepilin peptidase [Candidatus Curtissbacteria bacterium]
MKASQTVFEDGLCFVRWIDYSRLMVFLVILFFVLGSIFGSFLNVVVDRLIVGQSILGRSQCDYCRKVLSPWDLVPVLSFLILRGKCRYCRRKLSWQYPAVESLTGLLFAATFYLQVVGENIGLTTLAFLLVITCVMVIVSVVDFKYSLIPTTFVFGASLLALFYDFFTLPSGVFIDHVAAAFVAATFFGSIVVLTRGRGMGSGDIVLAFLIGMVLGFPKMVLSVFVAFVAGSVIAILLLIFGRKRFKQTIPFGPFLVFGFYIALYWYKPVVSWYVSLFR